MDGAREPRLSRADVARAESRRVRGEIRSGAWTGQTAGLAPGMVQGNLAILPAAEAADFLRFCRANPKPCPVIGLGEPGDPMIRELGDIDNRTDLPRYRIWKDGELAAEPVDVRDVWRDDLVTFVLGCSFSFEEALLEAGLGIRHMEDGTVVSMYRTNLATTPACRFSGPMVVSMRPFRPADAIRAIQITSRFPEVHGAPVHFGDPAAIGIADIGAPDYGDPTRLEPGEIPLFWGCGVTPQAVIRASKVPFAITHAPGHMLITDRLNAELAAL